MIDVSKLTMGHRKSPTTVSNVQYGTVQDRIHMAYC